MKIGKKLSISFAAVLLLTLVVGIIGEYATSSLHKSYQSMIDDGVAKILMIKELEYDAASQTKYFRGYLVTGDQDEMNSYLKERETFATTMKKLQSTLVLDKPKQMAAQLQQMEAEYADIVKEITSYKQQGDVVTYTRLVEEKCKPMALALEQQSQAMEQYQMELLNQSQVEQDEKLQNVQTMIIIAMALALVIGIVLAYAITRMIARPVVQVAQAARRISEGDLTQEDIQIRQKDEIGEMAQSFNDMKRQLRSLMQVIYQNAQGVMLASGELSSGSGQVAEGARQMAETVQGIYDSAGSQVERNRENQQAVKESAEGVQKIAQSAFITAELSERAIHETERGNVDLEETVVQMRHIQDTMKDSVKVIQELGEQSKQIQNVTQFIRDIAKQTNLLSLNASIEAARAGESGKGFAVVAGEVKKLAEQTGQASQQIAVFMDAMADTVNQAVDSIQRGSSEVEAGTDLIYRTGQTFSKVHEAVQTVAEHTQDVSAATEELSAITEQLLDSEQKLVGLSREIAEESESAAAVCEEQLASMEVIVDSADSLRHMAAELLSEIQHFRITDDADENKASTHPKDTNGGRGTSTRRTSMERISISDTPIHPAS
ncbi:methyl-accepting chemotaxis protein [Paenibacillus terrae]|uniref:Methyl-accepting chemotaxis protein n=1 Tax=Paenibacillus terrae TaxID=159743 RepID=A0A4U2Q3R7_9BACL|nr:methyl-accepting chemotaxis protein [Paenibacillus terrae]TKH45850.1 methyl-accepting chemotaxis protein [Paenibacillus terrae]